MSNKNDDTVIINGYEDYAPADPSESERQLMKAVLENAIADLDLPGYEGKQAQRFFMSQDDHYLFSFKSICEYLSIDPKQILMMTGLIEDPLFMNSYQFATKKHLEEDSKVS